MNETKMTKKEFLAWFKAELEKEAKEARMAEIKGGKIK
jgi:hypothetical protein